MFSPPEFSPPPKPQSAPFWDNRIIGTIILIVGIVLLIVMGSGSDQSVFIPYNATLGVTQTWRAEHPPTITATPRNQRRATATPTRRPSRSDDDKQSAGIWSAAS
ncbi:MAG: hypothetical protein KF726_08535 [Anaerolineae bacterium]|nr:hypothetical protein [Anaerolineae bacterium]